MTLIDKLKVPVLVAGLGLAGIVGCSKEGDISKINLDVVKEFKLTREAIDWLKTRGVPADSANAYDRRFLVNKERILNLYDNGIMPGVANSYDETLFDTVEKIVSADDAKLDNKTALEYNERFDLYERVDLYANGVYPDIANPYHKSFSDDDIIKLHKREGISSKIANKYARLNELYGARISVDDVIRFIADEVPYSVIEERAKQLMIDKSITE